MSLFQREECGGSRGKYHIQGTLTLLTCADSITSYHLSLRPTDPPPFNSPIMHSRLVCKNQKKIKTQIFTKGKKLVWRYANISDTLFDQKSSIHREAFFCKVMDKPTTFKHCNVQTDLTQRTESVIHIILLQTCIDICLLYI